MSPSMPQFVMMATSYTRGLLLWGLAVSILLFGQLSYGELVEPRAILSITILDEAFDVDEHNFIRRFMDTHFPDHRHVMVVIDKDDITNNIRMIQEAVAKLEENELIDLVTINTHGDYSSFTGIGQIRDTSLAGGFQNIARTIEKKLAPDANLFFNSCYAICGTNEDAIKKVRVLQEYFKNKLGFVFASETAMNSFEEEYEQNLTEVSENDVRIQNRASYLAVKENLLKLRIRGIGSYYLVSLRNFTAATAIAWYGNYFGLAPDVIESIWVTGTAFSIIQPFFSDRVQQARKMIRRAKKNLELYMNEGFNKGRVFKIDGDEISVKPLGLYDRPRILEAYGVCEAIFQKGPQE